MAAEMLNVANHLRETIDGVLPSLEAIPDAEAGVSPAPGKWSKKEILGHLIDSACNNQQKFVRAMAASGLNFVGYQQDFWVGSQKYDQASWKDLIALWRAYNIHIAHIIEHAAPGRLTNMITIEDAGTFTLQFIMEDYVEHLKHHLLQILPGVELTTKFQNIYNT
jgi:hypothetical protein